MEGELLTRCLRMSLRAYGHGILHLHVIEAGGDILTLRSRGLGLAQGGVKFIYNA